VLVAVLTAFVRVFFNLWHAGRRVWWIPAAGVVAVVVLALWLEPKEAKTGAKRPVPLEDVVSIFEQRCNTCHSGIAAPLGIRFETFEQIEARADDIERQAVLTRAMPPGNATGMTDEERGLLGAWIRQSN
ncbi:MAG: hypothetical protein WD380_09305, partial [Gaiellaceae bacterium]